MDSERQELRLLVERSESVDFALFGEGCADRWIEQKQRLLGIELPPTYKWWLRNYGGGEVGGLEILSVYEADEVIGGDVVAIADINRNTLGIEATEKLYVMESGQHSAFFDTARGATDGEYVVVEELDGEEIEHRNFLSFLISLIERFE